MSEIQIDMNGVNCEQSQEGKLYINIDGYGIPITINKSMVTVNVRKTTEQEQISCTFVDLTSDLPWNTEKINNEYITPH